MRPHNAHRRTWSVAAAAAVALALAASALAGARATAPTISGFTPTSAKASVKVTISGKNLKGATAVKVDGMPMKYRIVSATRIVATLSKSAKTGKITVRTPHGTATSASKLTVL
jgi:hypothetical protein